MSKKTKVSFFGGIWSILANYVKAEKIPSYLDPLYAMIDDTPLQCYVDNGIMYAMIDDERLFVLMEPMK